MEFSQEDDVLTNLTIVYYYIDSKDIQGSLNKRKILLMAQGRPINQAPYSEFKGHLLGYEYI